jgi:colanic acid/amylovoran biosynthesis glycosyltransferase
MSKPKSIVFILGGFPYASETFITNHIVETIAAGYDVRIYTNHLNTIEESSQKELIQRYGLLNKATVKHVKTPESFGSKILKSLVLLIKNPKYIPLFLRIIKSNKLNKHRLWYEALSFKDLNDADIYHSHFADQSLFISDLIEVGFFKKSFKLFVTFHGYDAHLKKTTKSFIKENYQRLLNHAQIVFVNSSYIKSKVEDLGCEPQKIEVMPIGVDTSFFKYKIRKQFKPFIIITVGRLMKLKGQDFGIRVINNLVERGCDVEYLIIGDGKEKNTLQRLIEDLEIQGNVKLLGEKTQSEVLEYLYKSNVFLMTSVKDNSNRSEAFGLVSIEAQATGIPVVAFDSGGVSSTFKDGYSGYLTEEKNIEMMADKVESLINNEAKLLEMGNNAKIFVGSHFDSKLVINKHIEFYNS